MSYPDEKLPDFGIQRVLSDAVSVFQLGLRPLAIIFGVDAAFEFAIDWILSVSGGSRPLTIINAVATLVFYCWAFSAAMRVLHNIGYGKPPDLRGATGEVVEKSKHIALVGIGAIIAIACGLVALVLPGAWLGGLWAVIFPALMIENAGLSAFKRSADLTRGYRWQAVGTLGLAALPFVLLAYLVNSLLGVLPFAPDTSVAMLSTVVLTGIDVMSHGAAAAATLAIYKRLLEVKESGDPYGVAEIFD